MVDSRSEHPVIACGIHLYSAREFGSLTCIAAADERSWQVYRAEPRLASLKIQDEAEVAGRASLQARIRMDVKDTYVSIQHYFRHPAWMPSFALSLLYLTVLSFGGQMVTYLLSAGFNSFYIGLVRSLAVVFELSATWLAPRIMRLITPVRAGLWFLSWQIGWLLVAVPFFWSEPKAIVAASGLCAGTILSRVGLWGYDLSAQTIIQGVRSR